MPVMKRQKADGTWEYIQTTGLDVSQISSEITTARGTKANLNERLNGVDSQLADAAMDLKQREINVRQPPYNAKANGVDDDTSIIQSAIDSLGTTGGTIFLPDGTYKTTGTLVIPKYVKLRGSSSRGTIIQYYGTGTALNMLYNNSNIGLETIQIERKNASKTGTIGVLLEASLFCTLKDVRVLDFETGYKIDGKDLWCASNVFYNLFSMRCTFGIHITADVNKQSNHNIFFGGYIYGNFPLTAGSKGVVMERGDSNTFVGTAVEDYDIGWHFIAVDSGGNGAISPRAERCNTNYLIDANTTKTMLVRPFSGNAQVSGITNNSQTSMILTSTDPIFMGNEVYWSNNKFIKFLDSGGAKKDVIGADATNNMIYKTPSFTVNKKHAFQVADSANIHQEELAVTTDEVKVRRHLKLGNITSLPTADSTHRGRMVTIQGGAGVADKLYICMKSVTDTYSWVQIAIG